jgi:hypothetical protein
MDVVSEEARVEREQWLSSGDPRALSDRQPCRYARKAQAWDARAQMRWVGVSLCILSAALTLVSAALIAVRL